MKPALSAWITLTSIVYSDKGTRCQKPSLGSLRDSGKIAAYIEDSKRKGYSTVFSVAPASTKKLFSLRFSQVSQPLNIVAKLSST